MIYTSRQLSELADRSDQIRSVLRSVLDPYREPSGRPVLAVIEQPERRRLVAALGGLFEDTLELLEDLPPQRAGFAETHAMLREVLPRARTEFVLKSNGGLESGLGAIIAADSSLAFLNTDLRRLASKEVKHERRSAKAFLQLDIDAQRLGTSAYLAAAFVRQIDEQPLESDSPWTPRILFSMRKLLADLDTLVPTARQRRAFDAAAAKVQVPVLAELHAVLTEAAQAGTAAVDAIARSGTLATDHQRESVLADSLDIISQTLERFADTALEIIDVLESGSEVGEVLEITVQADS